MDDGLEWKDGDTMHWWVLLTEDYTVRMSEGARRDRARINAFCSTTLAIEPYHSKPLADHKTQCPKIVLTVFC